MVDYQQTNWQFHRTLVKMLKNYCILLLSLLTFSIQAQVEESLLSPNAAFEPNRGQWEGKFDFRLETRGGALFFEDGGYSVTQLNPEQWIRAMDHAHAHGDEDTAHTSPIVPFEKMQSISYRVKYLGANLDASKKGSIPFHYYVNYFRGNDSTKWKSQVPRFSVLTYESFYPNINLRYYSKEDQFKYDFVISPGGDPSQIRWKVDGTNMEVSGGRLRYKAPFGDIEEWEPVVYQNINGTKTYIQASYSLSSDGIASFNLGEYNPNYELVIDPVVVFATFSGSTADNWGFTATYDLNGGLYGGGICFNVGYPTTTGVYDPSYNSTPAPNSRIIDATISKYSANGSTLLFATYLGGSESDQPHSMIVNSQGQLVVFGVTGSADFPTSGSSADNTFNGGPSTYPFKDYNSSNYAYRFPQGTDAYVAIFSSNGANLVGSTFLGGSGRDGINTDIQRNYGDGSRGEVVVDDNDNIYITTTTQSGNYPLVNSNVAGNAGGSDVAITKLNPTATNILWSTMFGGSGDDQGYGIKVSSSGHVYVTGGTNSPWLTGTTNGINPSYMGGTDGYIVQLDAGGSVLNSTYIGTTNYDQSYFIDIDKNHAIYVFGQTLGNYPQTPNTWTYGNSRLFIHKLSPDLTSTLFSTNFGSGNGTMSLVPTAFNVDECLNILLSGWGGGVNSGSGFLGGNTRNMPITSNATQATTDGSDFYFMSLAVNASKLTFATYFGGSQLEHVDGGTSRFSPDGQIYQAVCAGCGGSNSFPVTPGAYSITNNSNNCNLGNVKFNFEVEIDAAADINYETDVDTVCNTMNVQFTNDSKNANLYEWDFGNGQTSSDEEPSTQYTTFGVYTIRLVAIDTICDISDTAYLTVEHEKGIEPQANFTVDYNVCDQSRTVYITNKSRRATNYHWNFGNGVLKDINLNTYSYPAQGQYTIRLIVEDSVCNKFDTAEVVVNFVTDIPPPLVNITPTQCEDGRFIVSYQNDSSYYKYRWEWEDGTVEYAKYPITRVPYSGQQTILLTIIDDKCGQTFEYSFDVDISRIDQRVFIPNAFTPNGDGVNDVLLLKGNECMRDAVFTIYNRWGQVVFTTDKPFGEFWDGTYNEGLKEDTYTWRFDSEDGTLSGMVTIIP